MLIRSRLLLFAVILSFPTSALGQLIHSDLPLFTGNREELYPISFSDGDSFGCSSRVAFGDWKFRETVTEANRLIGKEYFPASNGTMRGSFTNRIPLIRMTNIYLEPGETEWEDMIASTEQGLLLDTNVSWSIDDLRRHFSFGVEVAREIRNGKIGQLYKNAHYTGMTTEVWGNCDAICNRDRWAVYATPNCGKGQPGQVMLVGHAAPPARFKNVKVGSRRR